MKLKEFLANINKMVKKEEKKPTGFPCPHCKKKVEVELDEKGQMKLLAVVGDKDE